MATEVIACPACRAPGPLGPDATGEYRCIYCGTRFHRTSTHTAGPQPGPTVANATPPAKEFNTAATLIAAGFVGLIGAGIGVLVFLAPSEPVGPTRPPAVVQTPTSTISAPVSTVKAPEPEPPATANFEFHRIQSGYETSFYALGFVTNTSPFIIDQPKVIAVLLDAQGQEVGTDFGYGERDVLGPGERTPIKILISDPPEHASVRYEVVVSKASYIPAQVAGLRIEPSPARRAKWGKDNWELEGKVHNEGQQPAKFVSIEIQALDAEGKLVGVGNTYADAEVLAPGAMARYSTQITVTGEPDRFDFVVESRVAD